MHRTNRAIVLTLLLLAAGPALQAVEGSRGTDTNLETAEALIAQADALSDIGDYESALELYVEATQVDLRAAMAFRGAGYVLLLMGRAEEAIPYLKDAIKIDPSASRPWENLGLAYSAVYDQVSGESRELARTAPGGPVKDIPEWQRIHVLREKLDEMDWRGEALACLREAVRLEPGEAKYWYNLGTTIKLYRPVELDDAIDALLKALELDGSYYPTLRNLALALKRQGRRREAREICLRMEQVSGPDDPAVAAILGDLAFEDGDYEEAEKRYRKLLELEPDSIRAHIFLAHLYHQTGNLERAQEITEKAVALDPENETTIRETIEQYW